MKQIEVVAAIIRDEEGCVFATQRGYGEWKCQRDWQLTGSTCPVTWLQITFADD